MTYKTLPTPPSSNQQVREYTTAVEKGFRSIFVNPHGARWTVELVSNQKVVGTFASKTEALIEAEKRATASKGTVFVFDSTGELIETH
ncbi:MAG: DUF2188 domain-containing protein [Patescibacteria group bacterium]